ncbi:MAG: tryptophan-rich sensory protein [Notoacmeibacter sp.]|nr:tryptophan-rich sensory protein [Notoacmeibacter sp.]
MNRYLTLALFLLFTVGGGLLTGLYNMPGEWYQGLVKPSFNPPPWLFGPVWTILYVLIAFAGWRTWQRRAEGPAMQVWFAQMVLNFAWSPVFFTAHAIGFALAILVMMWVLIAWFIWLSWDRDRIAAYAFIPYFAWVSFAGLLNASIWILN